MDIAYEANESLMASPSYETSEVGRVVPLCFRSNLATVRCRSDRPYLYTPANATAASLQLHRVCELEASATKARSSQWAAPYKVMPPAGRSYESLLH